MWMITAVCLQSRISESVLFEYNRRDHSGAALFQQLVDGRPAAFRAVYADMLVEVVASPVPIAVLDSFPETLLLDRRRLVLAQIEFNRIVDGMAVLTLAVSLLEKCIFLASSAKRSVGSECLYYIMGLAN